MRKPKCYSTPVCPDGYGLGLRTTTCYRIGTMKKSYVNAVADCEADGGRMAIIRSEKDYYDVMAGVYTILEDYRLVEGLLFSYPLLLCLGIRTSSLCIMYVVLSLH